MKHLITCILAATTFYASAQSLSDVRAEFHGVVLNADNSKQFHQLVQGIDQPTATLKAYQAVSEALLAQVLWNPYTKLKQVMKYDKLMEEAVQNDPKNIEIRFLRLAIEYNLPSFLGMSKHVNEDLKMITKNLSDLSSMQVNPIFGQYIFHFLEETDLCSESQLSQMKQTFHRSATAMAGSK